MGPSKRGGESSNEASPKSGFLLASLYPNKGALNKTRRMYSRALISEQSLHVAEICRVEVHISPQLSMSPTYFVMGCNGYTFWGEGMSKSKLGVF